MLTCHENMPVISEPYFSHFTPAALALICEASLLELKLGRMTGIECGTIWASVRSIERGESKCPSLDCLSSTEIEASYSGLYRKLPREYSDTECEHHHGMNLLLVLPPRCEPNARRLDFRRPVTPGILLAEIMAKFDFKHGTNFPLWEKSLNVPEICESLMIASGFSAGPALCARGTIPENKRALYDCACEKAAFVGTWLVRDIHLAAAADELECHNEIGPALDNLLDLHGGGLVAWAARPCLCFKGIK